MSSHSLRHSTGGLLAATCIALTAFVPTQAQSDREELRTRVFTYLDNLTSLSGRYQQSAADQVVEGDFYIQRPGRLHFDEDGDSGQLLIADGRWLAVIDARSEVVQRYALAGTPFGALLGERPSANADLEVVNIRQRLNNIFLTLTKQDEAELGVLTLILNDDPIRLAGWIIADPQQRITQVKIDIDATNVTLDADLFDIAQYERDSDR